MMRRVSVTILSYRAYVYDSYLILIRLSQYGIHNIFRRRHIHTQGLFRIVIRSRRYHSTNMKNIVRPGNAGKYILIFCKVSPDDSNRRIRHISIQFLTVLLAVAGKNPYVKSFFSLI